MPDQGRRQHNRQSQPGITANLKERPGATDNATLRFNGTGAMAIQIGAHFVVGTFSIVPVVMGIFFPPTVRNPAL